MTDVTSKAKWLGFLLLALNAVVVAQSNTASPGAAERLYLRLRSVGLDSKRVYKIRQAALDRGSIHISLDDGTIAFAEDADGHVTGALFEGEGEILVAPPNAVERGSLALFTGAAILEEKFSFAYFRFNDDVFGELEGALRETDNAASFAVKFNPIASTLAPSDALRLLITFQNGPQYSRSEAADHFLHAYIQGYRLGAFEARYDSLLPEPVSLGQHKKVAGVDYYDVWTSFAQKKPTGQETDPDTGLNSTRDFEITQFNIRSEIKPPTDISAAAVLSLMPKRNGSRLLVFELSRLLQVESVEANGRAVEFIHNQAVEGSKLAKRGNDSLVVLLPAPMKAGEPIQLKITYSGAVLSEAANGLLYVGEHGTWYPNIGFSMASFDMTFRYPAGWTLVAVGRRTELRSEGSQQVSHWVTERKVPVAGFNLGKYSQAVTRAAGVDVETYATATVEKGFVMANAEPLPEPRPLNPGQPAPMPAPLLPRQELPSPSRNLQMVGGAAGQAIEFYSHHFGPYPYSGLMLTQFPGFVSQGWPGLVFLSSYAFLSPQELEQALREPAERLAAEQVVAHETAHQWWGDLITFAGYRDEWLVEALANYSAMALLESRNPAAFRQLMQKYRDDLLAKGSDDKALMEAGPVTLGLRLSSSKFPNAYQPISYGRGTWMFHMLRTMLRDAEQSAPGQRGKGTEEPFFRALREVRERYEGRSITTGQLLAVFEEQLPKPLWYEGKKSLDWFYESWLGGTAVPSFELRDVKISSKEGSALVSGIIVQDHAPDTLVTSVPLYAVVGNKPVLLRRVFAEGKESAFRITAPAGTRKILLDPEQTLLSRAK